MKSMRRVVSTLLLAGSLACGVVSTAHALSVQESFANATAPGWTLSGLATLTGTGAPDPVGQGWLRLTPLVPGGPGFAYHDEVVPTDRRITVTFQFAAWGDPNFGSADGLTFFLFDATGGFTPGNPGLGGGGAILLLGSFAVLSRRQRGS